jgi:hypothetical protein
MPSLLVIRAIGGRGRSLQQQNNRTTEQQNNKTTTMLAASTIF